jgi:hypothetical protein
MHAVLKLNMLVVLRVFMVSSSLINYKAPEFYRCISKWDLLTMRVASFAKRCGLFRTLGGWTWLASLPCVSA